MTIRPAAKLTAAQARTLHLHAQGLRAPAPTAASRADVMDAIARMALLQIDTIHVVARSPYLVLFSRLGDYDPRWLDSALESGEVFETWAHEACFAPMADWGLLRRRNLHAAHWAHRHAQRTRDADAGGMAALLEHVRERGAVRAADFAGSGQGSGGWWGWKDEKRFLEAWFALGELMVAKRVRFQRVYDLSERVLARAVVPPGDVPGEAEAVRAMRLRAIRALGITQARWVSDYYRLGPRVRDVELEPLHEAGEVVAVEVSGWGVPGWVHRDHLEVLAQVAAGRLRATHATLLSPFDPVVWHRERASALMGFDYTLECYTPGPKRAYGYFVLPILVGNRLVGRLDAKAWRAERTFEVKALYLEEDVAPTTALLARVAHAIVTAARWHGTPKVKLGKCSPRAVAVPLRAAVRAAEAATRLRDA